MPRYAVLYVTAKPSPALADIFAQLGYMERQGNGFKKITEVYYAAHNYHAGLAPEFYSDVTSFQVALHNLNYGTAKNSTKVTIDDENVAIASKNIAIEGLNVSQSTIEKANISSLSHKSKVVARYQQSCR